MNSYKITAREKMSAANFPKEREYWLEKFQGFTGKSFFVYDDHRSADSPYKPAALPFQIPEALGGRMMNVCGNSETKMQILLFSLVVVLLHKYTFSRDITLGTTIDRQEADGTFLNTVLPLRVQWSGCSLRELLPMVRQEVLGAIDHQNYPMKVLALDDLELPEEPGFQLFDVGVLLENIQDNDYLPDYLTNLRFVFRLEGQTVLGRIEYNGNLYQASSVRRIAGHLIQAAEAALDEPGLEISGLHVLSSLERETILSRFNRRDIQLVEERTFLHLFQNNVKKAPGRVALVYGDHYLSYGELDRRADAIARTLRRRGHNGLAVCLLMKRSPLLALCILAAWKNGCFYIPLDVRDPWARVSRIAHDVERGILVAEPGCLVERDLKALPIDAIEVDGAMPVEEDALLHSEEIDVQPGDMAYVIYTSGSTGQPKGAVIHHSAMLNHLKAKLEDLRMTDNDTIAQTASHTFDISVWQLFAPLAGGGKSIIYDNSEILDTNRFVAQLSTHDVSILEVVPSYLSTLLDAMEESGDMCRRLRYLMATGETLQRPLVERWLRLGGGRPIVNAYGPTEAGDDITHHFIREIPGSSRVPVGKPVRNLAIYITDPLMNLCPPGVVGEICVSGAGVGFGYLNDPEKTAGMFLANPFGKERGTILYKTGDLGRWLDDGSIEFFGRKDYQVKIRGYRIELGEIEAALTARAEVKEAVVVDCRDSSGDKFLCAYIQPAGSLELPALKEDLGRVLPPYMVPSTFCLMDSFPRSRSGKIDRNQLPDPVDESGTVPFVSTAELEGLKDRAPVEEDWRDILENPGFLEDFLRRKEREGRQIDRACGELGLKLYPLSQAQKMMYFTEKRFSGTSCLNNVFTIRYNRQLSLELLERAVNSAIQTSDALRTRIIEIDGPEGLIPALYFAPFSHYRLDRFDFSAGNGDNGLDTWVRRQTVKPFDLIDSRLFYIAYIKFDERDSGYYIKIHHLVSDALTFNILVNTIDNALKALEKGEELEHPDMVSYSRYIQRELEYFKSSRAQDDRRYWLQQAFPFPQALPLGGNDGDHSDITGEVCRSTFSPELTARLLEFCHSKRTTSYKLLLSALTIYWTRMMRRPEAVIGTVNHGRADKQDRLIPGVFIRFIPLRMTLEPDLTFEELAVSRCSRVLLKTLRHVRYPFHMLAEEVKEQAGYDINYFLDINLIDHPDFGEDDFTRQLHYQGADPTPLTIKVNPSNKEARGILELEWNYQKERFTEKDMLEFHHSLSYILEEAMNNPGIGVMDIEIAPESQREESLRELNREERMLIHGKWVDMAALESFALGLESVDNGTAVLSTDHWGRRRLSLFLQSRSQLEREPLAASLAGAFPWLAETGVELLQLEAIPVDNDGAIDHRLLELVDPAEFKQISIKGPRDNREKKLVDTWKELLKREHIGIDDDFFMIGGDSIKAIQLISRMKREGYQLEMKNVFEFPTVAQLAGQLKKETRTVDQSPVTGSFPLTPVQQMFFDVHTTCPHYYNQALVLSFPPLDEVEALQDILTYLQRHHDALRLTFRSHEEGVVQENKDTDLPVCFDTHDLRSHPDTQKRMAALAGETLSAVDMEHGPMMRTALFRLEDSDRLLVSVHYLAVDGISWRVLLEDIDTLWKQSLDGGDMKLPPKTVSFKQWAHWLREYAAAGDYLSAEEYWRKVEITGHAAVPEDFPHEQNLVADARIMSSALDSNHTRLLLTEANKAFNTDIMDILLTAFGLGIFNAFGSSTVEVLLEGHGRDAGTDILDVGRTVGRFNSIYPVVLRPLPEVELDRQLKETKEMLRRVPNKGFDYLVYRSLHKSGVTLFPQIGFIYLGQIDAGLDGLAFDVLQEVEFQTKSPREIRECRIDVVTSIEGEHLNISVNYNDKQFEPGTIERLMDSFKSALCQLIALCAGVEGSELTPSDLTYSGMSLDQLSALEDSLNE
jgi:amino acid adenylation domain-containing protein/non-ribosomal peptide synthase protein (TIGR01720 family)